MNIGRVSKATTGSLINNGVNGGMAGNDIHQWTGDWHLHQYAYHGKGKSIHSIPQMQDFDVHADCTSK